MEAVECPICLEKVRLPVRLRCFPCSQDTIKRHCFSIVRFCLLCARRFLELHKPILERSRVLKCLYCTSTCDLTTIDITKAYERDYLLFSIDIQTLHRCPWCPFQGTQEKLDDHIRKECPETETYCFSCKQFFKEYDIEHKIKCPLYIYCRICEDYVKETYESVHMKNVHQKVYCGCCHTWNDRVEDHSIRCPNRSVKCTFCKKSIFFSCRQQHWTMHMKEQHERVFRLKEMQKKEEERWEKMQKITFDQNFLEMNSHS